MKMGQKRQIAAVKDIAQERKFPRPVKVLTIAFHEDEDGNPTVPAINRTFRIAPYEKTCVFVDSACNEHRFTIAAGELDFTSGMVAVKEEEYDEEGNLLAIHNLSHEVQHGVNSKQSSFRDGKIAWYTKFLANSPNAVLSRFLPNGKKRAGILVQWQAQADSDEAEWLDGRCPTQDEVATAQREYEAQKEAKAAKRQNAKPQTPTAENEPAGVTEGEDFNLFNGA